MLTGSQDIGPSAEYVYRLMRMRHQLSHPKDWLLAGTVTQLVLAIISKDTRTPLERWVFDIKLVEPPADLSAP